jgi:hypothetical protein
MSYLDRLKGVNSENCPPLPLQELQKAPFDSFCSTHGARFQKIAPLCNSGISAQPADECAGNVKPIPPDLECLIVRAGAYWMYSPDDYAVIRGAARRDPEGLRRALEHDAAFTRRGHAAPAITGGKQA